MYRLHGSIKHPGFIGIIFIFNFIGNLLNPFSGSSSFFILRNIKNGGSLNTSANFCTIGIMDFVYPFLALITLNKNNIHFGKPFTVSWMGMLSFKAVSGNSKIIIIKKVLLWNFMTFKYLLEARGGLIMNTYFL